MHLRRSAKAVAVALALTVAPSVRVLGGGDAIVMSEIIDESGAFPSAHASTLVETTDGLVAAWFAGTAEGHRDVTIQVSRRIGPRWSPPALAAHGAQDGNVRYPCWNPVLFQPAGGPLLLFYKVGPSPREWWGEVRTSADGGRTWSAARRLPPEILGPIRAKPVEVAPGELLAGSSTEHAGWVVHMERFTGPPSLAALASAEAWRRGGPLNEAKEFEAIQPTILVHSPARVQILCRSRKGFITESWSEDAGRTWSPMRATALANPSAGIDALRLADGRFLLAYNPSRTDRRRLQIAVSADGKTWRDAVVLEDAAGEYSYPALIQARDGLVHVSYTWRRERIKHVVVDPARID